MHRLLIGFVLAVSIASISNTTFAQQSFDGRWTIEAIPEKGSCKRAHQYAVVIENGTIRNSSSRSMKANIAGGLEAGGRVRGSVQRHRTRVDVTGSLSERSGTGAWTTAGRVNCSGRWNAEKRS